MMNGELAREIIYMLFRVHQIAAYSVKNPDGKTVIAMLKATKLSKELKIWLMEQQGLQSNATFKASIEKMFQGSEVKL